MTTAVKEKQNKYFEAVGRRKTSTARVRLYPVKISAPSGAGNKGGGTTVNKKPFEKYFFLPKHQKLILKPFEAVKDKTRFNFSALIKGGGISSQAEALRHGISRALIEYEPELKKTLKTYGFVKRDPRAKERRKFGLKKARKSPQWSKR